MYRNKSIIIYIIYTSSGSSIFDIFKSTPLTRAIYFAVASAVSWSFDAAENRMDSGMYMKRKNVNAVGKALNTMYQCQPVDGKIM